MIICRIRNISTATHRNFPNFPLVASVPPLSADRTFTPIMLPSLNLLPRPCGSTVKCLQRALPYPFSGASSSARHFSVSSPTYIRKVKARPAPTKAKLAAKERKKALKARKNIYENEKMPLSDAVNVLRVSVSFLHIFRQKALIFFAFKGCRSCSTEFNL